VGLIVRACLIEVTALSLLVAACGRASYDPLDATPDTAADATLDASPDTAIDATLDASPDTAVDSGPVGCDEMLEEGLVASWTFDEATGAMVVDATGNGHDGTLEGSAARATGRVGAGMRFSSPDARVDVGTDPSLSLQFPMTLTAWVNPDRLVSDTRHSIVGRDDGAGTRQFEWGISSSRMAAVTLYPDCMSDGQVWVDGTTTVGIDGSWTHVAVTLSRDFVVSHYVDGAAAGSGALSRATICPEIISMSIGGTPYGPYPWEGALDEVRFYSRELSECEIAELRCLGDWHCVDGEQNCGESDVDTGADCTGA
jgi:hypothetical protein